ncbi:MAG: UvrD-helicase domain-containing protein [Longibaculum sp.]
MANGVVDNIFLVNAPAGSGKTTWIRQQVEHYLLQNPCDNVLCITYTNRAAEELGRDLDSKRVYFGTIHSFINDFISSFFAHSAIVDLYWEIYSEKIVERIENVRQDSKWAESNERYKEKYGSIDLETVRTNIKSISYSEAPFTSLYRGALSHDDLITFTRLVVDRFPVIKKKIVDKYQMIFIDEYQDTAADVLHIFYTSVVEKKSKLYLLGDKMQQIYKNYNGEFEEEFKTLNKSVNLSTNYRTTPKIVSILNAIYNDKSLRQNPYEKNSDDNMTFSPKVLIVSNPEKCVLDFREKFDDALVLYLSNKSRFHNIGVGELFDAFDKMEKYRYGRKYSAVDVLTKDDARDSDVLLTFLFIANQLVKYYNHECYGEVFRLIRKQHIYLNSEKYVIKGHSDKKKLKTKIERIISAYNNTEMTINHFLETCNQEEFIREKIYSSISEDSDYQFVKNVKVQEIILLSNYLNNPKISTQHGVKGESHDTVVFVAEDSKGGNSPVHMSKFFELWSDINVTLSEFDSFYYDYSKMIKMIEVNIGMKCSELKAKDYVDAAETIDSLLQSFITANKTNPYYICLLKEKMNKYYGKKNVTNAKDCLKEGTVYGPLCAYRLFYVGCSRARRNLAIVINKTDVSGFEDKLRVKLENCGFSVE